jgi:hypothetical protein
LQRHFSQIIISGSPLHTYNQIQKQQEDVQIPKKNHIRRNPDHSCFILHHDPNPNQFSYTTCILIIDPSDFNKFCIIFKGNPVLGPGSHPARESVLVLRSYAKRLKVENCRQAILETGATKNHQDLLQNDF